jgi:peptide/nickel transport system permease protein
MSGAVLRSRSFRAHPSLLAGAMLLALVLAPSLLSAVWTPWPPLRLDIIHRLAPPSAAHWLGTDPFGRDLLSILMVGARNSLIVGVAAIALAVIIGIPAGLAATGRGIPAMAVSRATDLGLAFPPLLTAAMVVAVYGAGMTGTILAIALFNVPAFVRLTRTQAASVLSRDFIAAARVAGRGRAAVLAVHVLPNIAGTLVVQATLALALAALSEAGLSYLGLGVPPPAPSLGRALADYQTRIFDDPLLVVAPGAVIALLVLGFNQLGDGLRDLLDPRIGR